MPTSKGSHKGFSYRFDLGAPTSAVDLMFDVFVPGPEDKEKAVVAARKVLEETIGEDGTDFGDLRAGRLYFHPDLVTVNQIVDSYPSDS